MRLATCPHAAEHHLTPDLEDEIIGGACVCHEGAVVNERVKSLLA